MFLCTIRKEHKISSNGFNLAYRIDFVIVGYKKLKHVFPNYLNFQRGVFVVFFNALRLEDS